jgi:ceramide glucosyltransferase
VTVLFSIAAATTVLFLLMSDSWRLRRMQARASPVKRPINAYPSVSIIRPVRGLDVGAEENLKALLDLSYPQPIETIVVFDESSDPAYPIMQRLVAERPAASVQLLIAGPPPPGRTGKLNAMMVGLAASHGELIAFNDSDTRPQKRLLLALADALLADPDAADAFAPALVAEPPCTAGDAAYATLINAWYGPAALRFAHQHGGLPFIMGQFMIWRRNALNAIGGLRCAEGQLVDDMALGHRAASAGYHNVLIHAPLHIYTGGMRAGAFWHLLRRWMAFSRNGMPWRFTWALSLRAVVTWLSFVVLFVAIWRESRVTIGFSLGALAASTASCLIVQRLFGGAAIPFRYWWVPLALVIVMPFALLSSVVQRRIDWRGRSYRLQGGADLKNREAVAERSVSV